MSNQKIPVACNLSEAQFRQREETLLNGFRTRVLAVEALSDGYAFSLPGGRECIQLVADLIAAEHECCPFLTFEMIVQAISETMLLRVTGPSGTKEFLQELFCPPPI